MADWGMIASGLGGAATGMSNVLGDQRRLETQERIAKLQGEVKTTLQGMKQTHDTEMQANKQLAAERLRRLIDDGKLNQIALENDGDAEVQRLRNEGKITDRELQGFQRMSLQERIEAGLDSRATAANTSHEKIAAGHDAASRFGASTAANAANYRALIGNEHDAWKFMQGQPLNEFKAETGRIAATRPRVTSNPFLSGQPGSAVTQPADFSAGFAPTYSSFLQNRSGPGPQENPGARPAPLGGGMTPTQPAVPSTPLGGGAQPTQPAVPATPLGGGPARTTDIALPSPPVTPKAAAPAAAPKGAAAQPAATPLGGNDVDAKMDAWEALNVQLQSERNPQKRAALQKQIQAIYADVARLMQAAP